MQKLLMPNNSLLEPIKLQLEMYQQMNHLLLHYPPYYQSKICSTNKLLSKEDIELLIKMI